VVSRAVLSGRSRRVERSLVISGAAASRSAGAHDGESVRRPRSRRTTSTRWRRGQRDPARAGHRGSAPFRRPTPHDWPLDAARL